MSFFKKKNKNLAKELAKERIQKLFELAESEHKLKPYRSDEYVGIARKIGMRYLVRFPRELKVRYCKTCGSYLVPGNNCRFRLRKKCVVLTCLKCGSVKRYPYNPMKNSKNYSDHS
ncbi:MAG: ribonuclease P [Methanomethylovorans sp.]|jgi:ribonuclease P protein subunit RPR2|nr:ribonuclease P [Methanomethylovorans sp.]